MFPMLRMPVSSIPGGWKGGSRWPGSGPGTANSCAQWALSYNWTKRGTSPFVGIFHLWETSHHSPLLLPHFQASPGYGFVQERIKPSLHPLCSSIQKSRGVFAGGFYCHLARPLPDVVTNDGAGHPWQLIRKSETLCRPQALVNYSLAGQNDWNLIL